MGRRGGARSLVMTNTELPASMETLHELELNFSFSQRKKRKVTFLCPEL